MKSTQTATARSVAALREQQPARSLLKEREVVGAYPWSRALMRKWRRCGGGPAFVRLNRAIYYRTEAIEEFLKAHEVKK
jgi:hypothetical protein